MFMKRTVLFFGFSVATSILVITGCSKKNDAQSYTVKQLAGTYKLTAATATSGSATVDMMQFMDDCEKQDLNKLNADSTYEYITTCNGGNTSEGKWVVKGNLLISDPDTYPDTVTIKSFNGSTLVFTITETDQGVTVVNTSTYTKQ